MPNPRSACQQNPAVDLILFDTFEHGVDAGLAKAVITLAWMTSIRIRPITNLSLGSATSSGCGCWNSTNSKPSVSAGLRSLIVTFDAECGKAPMQIFWSLLESIILRLTA